jgi:hypothetical protein
MVGFSNPDWQRSYVSGWQLFSASLRIIHWNQELDGKEFS